MGRDDDDRVGRTLGAIRATGYAVWHGWVDESELTTLRAEAHHALDTLPQSEYAYGRRVNLSTVERTELAPATRQLLVDGPVSVICQAYGADSEHDYLQWTEETKPDAGRGPGRPHIGPTRQLKLIVYLTNVLSTSGPLRIQPTDRDAAEQRWLATWRQVLDLGDDATDADVYRQADAYSPSGNKPMIEADAEPIEPVDPSSLKPIVGLAGSIVFFDTQVVHCGGSIDPGGYRLTARRHCTGPLP